MNMRLMEDNRKNKYIIYYLILMLLLSPSMRYGEGFNVLIYSRSAADNLYKMSNGRDKRNCLPPSVSLTFIYTLHFYSTVYVLLEW